MKIDEVAEWILIADDDIYSAYHLKLFVIFVLKPAKNTLKAT